MYHSNMQTRSKKIQQFYDGKDDYLTQNLTQLLNQRKERNLTHKPIDICDLDSWMNANDLKKYICSVFGKIIFYEIADMAYEYCNYNMSMCLIFAYCDGSYQKHFINLFDDKPIKELITEFDDNNLMFILCVYNFKFKFIYDDDELINTSESIMDLLFDRYKSYITLNQRSVKQNAIQKATQNGNEILSIFYDVIDMDLYDAIDGSMANRLYFINSNNKIKRMSINEHSLDEIIGMYESHNTIMAAISICNEQLFFDNLDSLILGLDHVKKYCPHSDDYWPLHKLRMD